MEAKHGIFADGELCWTCFRYGLIAIASIGLPLAWNCWLSRKESQSGRQRQENQEFRSAAEDEKTNLIPIVEEELVMENEKPLLSEAPGERIDEVMEQEELAQVEAAVTVKINEEDSKEDKEEEEEEEENGDDFEIGEDELAEFDDLVLGPAATVLEVSTRKAELRSVSPMPDRDSPSEEKPEGATKTADEQGS